MAKTQNGFSKLFTARFLKIPVWIFLTFALFGAGGGLAYLLTLPKHAGWRYGACRVFLEHYIRFPETIQIEEGGETRNSAVLIFSDINPFGARQVRVFECYYSQGPRGNVILSRILLDRRQLPSALVEKYNTMLPVITSLELDTALPKDFPDNLEDLKE